MARGTQLLRFPFAWLSDFAVPEYVVRPVVNPTVDVGQHNSEVQIFEQSFVMVVGNNTIFLPGLNRPAQLNGAVPDVRSKGARRWLSLAMQSSALFAAGDDLELSIGSSSGAKAELAFMRGASALPAATPQLLVGGSASFCTTVHEDSVYCPDPLLLFVFVRSMAAGTTLTLRGTFIETDTTEQPIPDMFA